MAIWAFLWKALLILGLGSFAVMAVWVTIAGWRDIGSLFRTIDDSHHKGGDE